MKYIIGWIDGSKHFNSLGNGSPIFDDPDEALEAASIIQQYKDGRLPIIKVFQIQEVDHDLRDHHDPENPFELEIGGEGE